MPGGVQSVCSAEWRCREAELVAFATSVRLVVESDVAARGADVNLSGVCLEGAPNGSYTLSRSTAILYTS
jgi:hypothetical protein